MKPLKKEKSVKLELIKLLADSNVNLEYLYVENDNVTDHNINGWLQYTLTGRSKIVISIYNKNNDITTPETKS